MKASLYILSVFLLTLIISATVCGQDGWIYGKITYISSSAVYTTIGKDNFAVTGDTVYLKKETHFPAMVINAISRRSSACALLIPVNQIDTGMTVSVKIPRERLSLTIRPVVAADSANIKTTSGDSLWLGVIEKNNSLRKLESGTKENSNRIIKPEENILSGRVAFQYMMIRDRNNPDYNYYQPGAVLHVSLNRIQGSYWNLNSHLRFRNTRTKSTRRYDDYPLRIYEMSLEYDNAASALYYTVGRVSSPVINGIGSFDGGYVHYRLNRRFKLGGFLGTEPDYMKSTPQTNTIKIGSFIHYEYCSECDRQFRSTLAFSGQYVKGNIDREYLYTQNDLSLGTRWFLYQNSEFGINRSSLSRRNQTIELSNIYIMARYNPVQAVSLNLSFDDRKNVYLLQTYKSIPDSLFDDASRLGIRSEVRWRATKQLTLSANSSVRTRNGDSRHTYLHSVGSSYYNVPKLRMNLDYRFFYTTTPYTSAYSHSMNLSRFFSRLQLALNLRSYHYQYRILKGSSDRYSVTFDCNYSWNSKLFSSFEYEYSFGKQDKTDRLFLEFSFRL